MSELRDAVEEYLKLRRTLGSQLRGVDRVLRSFEPLPKEKGLPISPRTWRFAGHRSQSTYNRRPGLGAFGRCDVSPPGEVPRIRAQRCLRKVFCPTALPESGPPFTATRRSRRSPGRQANFLPPQD